MLTGPKIQHRVRTHSHSEEWPVPASEQKGLYCGQDGCEAKDAKSKTAHRIPWAKTKRHPDIVHQSKVGHQIAITKSVIRAA